MYLPKKITALKEQPDHVYVQLDKGAMRLWFLTDKILRVEYSPTEDFLQHSYQLMLTAWDDVTDDLFKNHRTRITARKYMLSKQHFDEGDGYEISSGELLVEVLAEPFGLRIKNKSGQILSEDIPGYSYRRDNNLRNVHMARRFPGDHYYGFGEKTGPLDKNEMLMKEHPSDALGYDAMHTDPLYKHIPFFVRYNEESKTTAGIFYHNASYGEFDMGKSKCNYYPMHYTYSADAGNIDYFVMAGDSIHDVVGEYTSLTGRPAMLPRYALGYLGSSMYYAELPEDCDRAIEDFADICEDEGVPMDGFQLSSGYTTYKGKRCVFTWDKKRFPDPADFFAEMKKRHIHVSCNVKPAMLKMHPRIQEFLDRDFFVKEEESGEPAVGAWWGGDGYYVDLTKPSVREGWKKELKEQLLLQGADSIWDDNCEFDGLMNEDVRCDMEGEGGDLNSHRSVIANIMCCLAEDASREVYPQQRPFVVCRAGSSGIGHFAQTWAGDNATSWKSLHGNISTMLGMGLSGVPNQGCDIGGFFGPAPDPELLLRWIQCGVFMPRFSVHSCNTDNTVTEPWMYPEVAPMIRDAFSLRNRLMPTMYSLMEEAHEKGTPILRSLAAMFPEDHRCLGESVEFMLGDALLVAPVTRPFGPQAGPAPEDGPGMPPHNPGMPPHNPGMLPQNPGMLPHNPGMPPHGPHMPVYLPAGENFIDISTGHRFAGGREFMVPVHLSEIPMFLREGAFLFEGECESYDSSLPVGPADYYGEPRVLQVYVGCGKDGQGTYYEDDGISMDYEKGIYCKSTLRMTREGDAVSIKVTREGNYTSATRALRIFLFCGAVAPFSISLLPEDEEIPRYLYEPNFREATELDEEDENATLELACGFYYHGDRHVAEIFLPRPEGDYELRISFAEDDLIKM